MKVQNTSRLYDQKQSVAFYEQRYEHGYMDEWPIEHKRKIVEIIQELPLPANGEALDFGCGNGVLTEVIRQALPSWKIYGTDLSTKAISNATNRYPNCIFFEANKPDIARKKFDFVFTNHVFEHVFDLQEVFNLMISYMKPESSMLHFLPCGNAGSFEHTICLLRKNGINAELGNRFFFEDEGHVRRLTTEDFRTLCRTKNFELKKEFYSNQYYGAISWITSYDRRFIRIFSDFSQAVDKKARWKLKKVRVYLIAIARLRGPAKTVADLWKKKDKRFKHYFQLVKTLPMFPISRVVDSYWKSKAREEWEMKRGERNGSEMALYFRRGS
jgi:SAM-dependent methyltransferase